MLNLDQKSQKTGVCAANLRFKPPIAKFCNSSQRCVLLMFLVGRTDGSTSGETQARRKYGRGFHNRQPLLRSTNARARAHVRAHGNTDAQWVGRSMGGRMHGRVNAHVGGRLDARAGGWTVTQAGGRWASGCTLSSPVTQSVTRLLAR